VLRKVIRMISEKGGVLLTNGHPGPRSLWKEDYLTSNETGGGDQRPIGGLHLGRSVTPLGNPTALKNERDIYRDILTKLDLGALYWWYGGRQFITRKHIVQHMYPITTESIHAGTVRGAERIVTRKSGVYGWHADRSLHQVHLYDARGTLTRHEFVSTVDVDAVRTGVTLGEDQAAVVVKLPITLNAENPLNVRVRRYDRDGIRILINGQGPVDLAIHTGDFAVQPGRTYAVTGAADQKLKAGADAVLSLRLDLRGPAEIIIAREN